MYLKGLVAGCLYATGKTKDANNICDIICKNQASDGSVIQTKTTITCSGGISKKVETTSIAILSWFENEKRYLENIEKAIRWLLKQCHNGRFGATQGTILALQAILRYEDARSSESKDGKVVLLVDGKKVLGGGSRFDGDETNTIVLGDFSDLIGESGDHTIELIMKNGKKMPYSISVEYFSVKPDNSSECKLDLSVALNKKQINEGDGTRVNVKVTNKTNGVLPMTIAIIGLPGGLEPRYEHLQELKQAMKINSYEVRGRNVVLYWKYMGQNQSRIVSFDVTARIPGKFSGQASTAYLYYTDEHKNWVDGLTCEIISLRIT